MTAKKKSKPTTVHALPVFAATREPGWLVLTGKKKTEVSKFFHTINPDFCSWEAPVKSWFIHHDRFNDAVDAIEYGMADPSGLLFCQDCMEARPCDKWATIPKLDYEFREGDDAEYHEEPDAPPPPTEQEPVGEDVVEDFIRGAFRFFEGVKKDHRERVSVPTAAGMTVKEAAAVLGVKWPCSKEEVLVAFRKAALKAHPDRGGSDVAMARVNRAREVLQQL